MIRIARRVTLILLLVIIASLWSSPWNGSGKGEARQASQEPVVGRTVPTGLPADTWDYYVPASNPITAGPITARKIALGRRLFFDQRLSANGTIACVTCHRPEYGFTDGKPVAEGIGGQRGTRNSMSLLNVIYNGAQFWDGRVDTLEEQALEPLVNPVEMGNRSVAEVVARLRADEGYRREFEQVFGGEIDGARIAAAIATFERTLVSGDSPFDRFQAGDENALSSAARRGLAVFRGRGRCSRCHTFSEQLPLFTNYAYQNTGVAAGDPRFAELGRLAAKAIERSDSVAISQIGSRPGGEQIGRALRSSLLFEIGSYRTPTLRNVGITGPYFHDGSARNLTEVVRFYNEGGRANLNLDEELHPLGLSEEEQRDLIAFLESLTGVNPR